MECYACGKKAKHVLRFQNSTYWLCNKCYQNHYKRNRQQVLTAMKNLEELKCS